MRRRNGGGFVRDQKSRALLNTDKREYHTIVARRQQAKRVGRLEDEVRTLSRLVESLVQEKRH